MIPNNCRFMDFGIFHMRVDFLYGNTVILGNIFFLLNEDVLIMFFACIVPPDLISAKAGYVGMARSLSPPAG